MSRQATEENCRIHVRHGGMRACRPTAELSAMRGVQMLCPVGAAFSLSRLRRQLSRGTPFGCLKGKAFRCALSVAEGCNLMSRGDWQGDAPLAPFQIGGPGGRNRNLPPGRFFPPFLDGTRNGAAGGRTGRDSSKRFQITGRPLAPSGRELAPPQAETEGDRRQVRCCIATVISRTGNRYGILPQSPPATAPSPREPWALCNQIACVLFSHVLF